MRRAVLRRAGRTMRRATWWSIRIWSRCRRRRVAACSRSLSANVFARPAPAFAPTCRAISRRAPLAANAAPTAPTPRPPELRVPLRRIWLLREKVWLWRRAARRLDPVPARLCSDARPNPAREAPAASPRSASTIGRPSTRRRRWASGRGAASLRSSHRHTCRSRAPCFSWPAIPRSASAAGPPAAWSLPNMDDSYSRASAAADPPYLAPDYLSTRMRAPSRPLIVIPQTLSEITGPVYGHSDVLPSEADLTSGHAGEPLGERIIVKGRVLDEAGRPVPNTLVEVWQCNAAGRYIHVADQHPAPLDPNFTGAGRCVTDADGSYAFVTIKPGAYPWRNHANAWRPAHIHFSLFGPSFLTRLVTQMYFPGDPLFAFDPIFNAVSDANARQRMVCQFDLATTRPEWALGYRFDIVLRGPNATPRDRDHV